MASASIEQAAKAAFVDTTRWALFDEQGTVLAASFTPNAAELKPLAAVFADRDNAIRTGMIVAGTRYEVHRHHPPVVYGRSMAHGGTPETSEGAAICKVDAGPSGSPAYGLITYAMPNISARMVPILQKFCEQHLSSGAPAAAAAAAAVPDAAGTPS